MSEAHIVPTGDVLTHTSRADCGCTPEPYANPDASAELVDWFWLHNAMDGRAGASGAAAFAGWVLLLPNNLPRSVIRGGT